MPDLITVYFNIETSGDTSSEAKDANSEISEKLIIELAKNGFDRSDLKTQGFNVYPDYIWEDRTRKENGYKASHSLKFELSSKDFDKVGDVIDSGVDSGAGISYINFELSQELQNQYKAQALELASKDARIKAEAVASGFGKKVGRLVSVQVSDFGYYPWAVYARSDGAEGGANEVTALKEAAVNIEPGEKEISARVSAVFKIR